MALAILRQVACFVLHTMLHAHHATSTSHHRPFVLYSGAFPAVIVHHELALVHRVPMCPCVCAPGCLFASVCPYAYVRGSGFNRDTARLVPRSQAAAVALFPCGHFRVEGRMRPDRVVDEAALAPVTVHPRQGAR